MWMYFFLAGAMGVLFWLSRGAELPAEVAVPMWQRPFYQGAVCLTGLWRRMRRKSGGAKRESDDVPRDGRNDMPRETERLAYVLMVLFAGLGITLTAETVYGGRRLPVQKPSLHRPDMGMGSRSRELELQVEDMTEAEKILVDVVERKYTVQEKRALLEEAAEQIETVLLGEGGSADEVRGSVMLPAQMMDGRVTVTWLQEPQGLLDEQGRITEELGEEGKILTVTAVLTCEEQELHCELALHLLPPVRTPWEELLYRVQQEIRRADEKSAELEELPLPQEVDGHRLIWSEPSQPLAGLCLCLTAAAAVCVWFAKEAEYRKERRQRQNQMILDYPDILFKLGMLLNAGLTMQNAFVRIAMEYRERRKKTDCAPRFAYEEMLAACYEMKSGSSEANAYENFGRRCGTAGYIRLGTLLSGGLQKGSEGLAKELLDEAVLSMEERRQTAKQLGEEAGTKLLLPMTGMLLVVLVILMMPAVMAF